MPGSPVGRPRPQAGPPARRPIGWPRMKKAARTPLSAIPGGGANSSSFRIPCPEPPGPASPRAPAAFASARLVALASAAFLHAAPARFRLLIGRFREFPGRWLRCPFPVGSKRDSVPIADTRCSSEASVCGLVAETLACWREAGAQAEAVDCREVALERRARRCRITAGEGACERLRVIMAESVAALAAVSRISATCFAAHTRASSVRPRSSAEVAGLMRDAVSSGSRLAPGGSGTALTAGRLRRTRSW